MEISENDSGFTSQGCGTWRTFKAKKVNRFKDGIWAVNDQVSPGLWQVTPIGACYWARISGFGGTLDEIISNANIDGSAIVQIEETDVGFISSGCGNWKKIG